MLINECGLPKVSIIIPTLNAGPSFGELLNLLQIQTIKPYEIIVIDSGSNDATASIAVDAGAKVISINRTDFDHGGTRNQAADAASGDILMFLTQDVVPVDNRLVEELVTPLMERQSDCRDVVYSYARQIAGAHGHIFEKLARESNYPAQSYIKSYEDIERLGIKAFFCSNACSAIRKDVFFEMGGFQSPVIFNEDMFMAASCILGGKKVAYCADAKVYHTHFYSTMQQFRRYFDNGVSMRYNSWILPYAKAGKAGANLVKRQIAGLSKAGKLHLLPKLVVESAAKLIGYKLGMNYHRLPSSLCRRLSMHKLIWDKLEGSSNTINAPYSTEQQKTQSF